jgi:hypothetical protein
MQLGSSDAFKVIAPYQRHNRDLKVIKNSPFYFVNSTYINASDPNSMRDQGKRIGNAEYSINILGCVDNN